MARCGRSQASGESLCRAQSHRSSLNPTALRLCTNNGCGQELANLPSVHRLRRTDRRPAGIQIVRDHFANKCAFDLDQDGFSYTHLLFIDSDSGNYEDGVMRLPEFESAGGDGPGWELGRATGPGFNKQ